MAVAPRREFVAASFNVHAGVDGWGRSHDVLGVCQSIDADLLVMQESWRPQGGESIAGLVASELGYQLCEVQLAQARLAQPQAGATDRWLGPLGWRTAGHAILLHSERPLRARVTRSQTWATAAPGSWELAVLSRLPVMESRVLPLAQLSRDRAKRAVVATVVDVGGCKIGFAGTHMSHLSHGSALHFRAVAKMLDGVFEDIPVVFAGDMNLWGPPIHAFMGQWRRAVKGKTWPAWRPHSQLDHLLVRGLEVRAAGVWPVSGSDHRPVWARLALPGA
ncbi:MAG: endonuclease/exonuclease/phosphatase family protein [Acidimicrobiales bacterium]